MGVRVQKSGSEFASDEGKAVTMVNIHALGRDHRGLLPRSKGGPQGDWRPSSNQLNPNN